MGTFPLNPCQLVAPLQAQGAHGITQIERGNQSRQSGGSCHRCGQRRGPILLLHQGRGSRKAMLIPGAGGKAETMPVSTQGEQVPTQDESGCC